jgi:hypothetical protein
MLFYQSHIIGKKKTNGYFVKIFDWYEKKEVGIMI